MPRFTTRQISAAQVDSIVRYVVDARHPDDRGGWAIGHVGPVTEGMVAWLLAGGALVLVAAAIGARRSR
jgi:ubiquinol-cytochrome c reductase cytochrome c subunit